MKCHSVQKKLSAYQDRELKSREQQKVGKHLLSCRSCQQEYAEFERLWQSLGELEEITPDPGFYRQLVRRINQPSERGLLPGFRRFVRVSLFPAIASLLLVIGIVVGIYLGNVIVRCDFLPFAPNRTASQETFLDSLNVFDPAPPGTLAHRYLQMVDYKENK